MSFTAKDVCNTVIIVVPTKMLIDVIDTMLKCNISKVIVEHNQMPVGMVTKKGIIKCLYKDNNNDKPLMKLLYQRNLSPLVSVNYVTDIKK